MKQCSRQDTPAHVQPGFQPLPVVRLTRRRRFLGGHSPLASVPAHQKKHRGGSIPKGSRRRGTPSNMRRQPSGCQRHRLIARPSDPVAFCTQAVHGSPSLRRGLGARSPCLT